MINSPKSESSPVPSVTNYPERDNPNWIIGFENDGEKVKTTLTSENINLTGAIIGSGSSGASINTTFSYPLNAGNNRIVSVGEPVSSQDGATKNYVDNKTVSLTGAISGSGVLGSSISTSFSYPLNGGNNRIVSVAEPIGAQDAATKNYVDTHGGGLQIVNSPFTVQFGDFWTAILASSNQLPIGGTTFAGVSSGIFQTNSGFESAAFYANGDYASIVQTFDNHGVLFQDEDDIIEQNSSIKSYISNTGSLVIGSNSAFTKKVKENFNDIRLLDKFEKIQVHLTSSNIPIGRNDSERKKLRKQDKNDRLRLSIDGSQLAEFLPFASHLPQYKENKNLTADLSKYRKDFLKNHEDTQGIDTYHLQIYQILAIKELISEVKTLKKQLSTRGKNATK